MSGVALPPVADTVLVAAVEALPARLRKKVDEAVTRFAALPVTAVDGRFSVTVDDTTTVTLAPLDGVVRSTDQATCTCLLAPNCLHRAAVLALAPTYSGGASEDSDEPAGDGPAPEPGAATPVTATPVVAAADDGEPGAGPGGLPGAGPGTPEATRAGDPGAVASGVPVAGVPAAGIGVSGGGPAGTAAAAIAAVDGGAAAVVPEEAAEVPLTVPQRAAVEHLWRAAVDVLAAGVTGSGTVARTALLRAAHEGQACKVYRPAAAARIVATMLQAARTGDPDYRLGDLTAALQDLIGVLHRLRAAGGGPAEGLLGSARRAYELQGSLRLHGLCTTAVLADSGYAGVVTYVADRDGRLWMVADLMPGDARRAAKAGNATVALGETALSHRALTRAGLVVSGATASATRQLGAGKSVRAVTARGCGWHEEPLAGLWGVPLTEQVHRAFEALAQPVTDRRAGDDLVFLSVRVDGTDGDAVHATAAGGTPLTLRVADESPALAYRDNLRLLGRATGLEMLVVARPDPTRPGTVFPLAVAPPDGTGWHLPAAQGGHADLAFDRLHRSHLPQVGDLATQDGPPRDSSAQDDSAQDSSPQDGPPQDGAPQNGPSQDGPPQSGSAQDGLTQDGSGGDDRALGGPGGGAQGADGGTPETDDMPGAAGTPAPSGRPAGAGAPGTTGPPGGQGRPGGPGGRRGGGDDPVLRLLAVQVERTVSGGRTVHTFAAGRGPSDATRLRRGRLDIGAQLLDRLTEAACTRPRDAFGRLAGDDGSTFAQAWLATAVYTDAATRAVAEATWLPAGTT